MKKSITFIVAVALIVALGAVGCAKKAASAQEAIDNSKSLKTVEEQVKYLVGQANAFISSKQFDQAISAARYVLSSLDQNSAQAKSVIEKAQEAIKNAAQRAVADVKNKLGGFGQ